MHQLKTCTENYIWSLGGGGAYEFREHETIRDKSNGKQKTERTFDSLLIDPF